MLRDGLPERSTIDAETLDLCLAIVIGLREAVCASVEPMPLERAQSLWQAHLARLGVATEPGSAEVA